MSPGVINRNTDLIGRYILRFKQQIQVFEIIAVITYFDRPSFLPSCFVILKRCDRDYRDNMLLQVDINAHIQFFHILYFPPGK